MLESKFQKELIKELHDMFPGCVVLKNDPNYIQGMPDLTVLYGDKWCTLEVKRSSDAAHQPNQDYYVDMMNRMSYSAFISPETKEDVLREVERTFRSCGEACDSESE